MKAIFQNGDTPELESTAVMLRAAGYDDVRHCGLALRDELVRAGCDTVLGVETMYALGYDRLTSSIREATPQDMNDCDLFLEIKVRNVPRIVARWPRLKGRILYKRVNGAQPEVCPKGGDEVNLPCPVMTACLWYGTERYRFGRPGQGQASLEHLASRTVTEAELRAMSAGAILNDNGGLGYTFWPPYPRSAEYDAIDRSKMVDFDAPFCIAHSAPAWGYGQIVDEAVKMGVKVYGNRSPHGQVSHRNVPLLVANGLALVHLKSVDCPGWALYEALLGGCPVITGRLLNSRMLAYDLLEHGETCYEFGVPASLEYGRGDMDFPKCLADIKEAMERLSDPAENRRVGENGRKRLRSLMWSADREEDVESFRRFLGRHFP